MSDTALQRARRLLEILDLEQVEENLYLGQNEVESPMRLFGGQVLAQATAAAYRTVDNVQLHSMHGYFIRAGSSERPVLYEIERIRDGRSFTTRRVVAIQNGLAIFNLDVSFQIEELGFEHAHPMPNVPLPSELEDDILVASKISSNNPRRRALRKVERPFETRSVFPLDSAEWGEDRSHSPLWIRFREPVDPLNQLLARSLLAYASDMSVVSTACLPHQEQVEFNALQMASLDHALWIHRPVPIDEWLLFHKRTSTAQGSRGLVHADFYTESGALLASMTQEGLLRLRQD